MKILKTLVAAAALAVGAIAIADSIDGTTYPIVIGTHSYTDVGGVVQQDGKPLGYSANVVGLAKCGGKLYQTNKAGGWWYWDTAKLTYVAAANPFPACAQSSSSSSSSSSSGSSTSSSSSTSSGSSSTSSSSSSGTAGIGIRACGAVTCSTKDGSKIELIGMNMSGLETHIFSRWAPIFNAGPAYWGGTFKQAHGGTNVVRLPLNALDWFNAACPGQPAIDNGLTYQPGVKKTVADITAAGMYTIVELHWTAPNGVCAIGQPGFADADHALAFWKQVADAFKNNQAVMFELFNEPFGSNVYANWVVGSNGAGVDAKAMFNGGSFTPLIRQCNTNCPPKTNRGQLVPDGTYNVAGMLQMIQVIRGEGAPNLILAPQIGWSGEVETAKAVYFVNGNPDPNKNLAMSMHCYGYNKGIGNLQAVLALPVPLVVTEAYASTVGGCGGSAWLQGQAIGELMWGPNDWGNVLDTSKTGWNN